MSSHLASALARLHIRASGDVQLWPLRDSLSRSKSLLGGFRLHSSISGAPEIVSDSQYIFQESDHAGSSSSNSAYPPRPTLASPQPATLGDTSKDESKNSRNGYHRKYYESNRERLIAYRKQYYTQNKEKIKAQQKVYYRQTYCKVLTNKKISMIDGYSPRKTQGLRASLPAIPPYIPALDMPLPPELLETLDGAPVSVFTSTDGWTRPRQNDLDIICGKARMLHAAREARAKHILKKTGYHVEPSVGLEEVLSLLDDEKALDVLVVDVDRQNHGSNSKVCDFIVLLTGHSPRHLRTIADRLVKLMRERGVRTDRTHVPVVEGRDNDEWMVVDGNSWMVHLFSQDARAYYDIDSLWLRADSLRRRMLHAVASDLAASEQIYS